MGPSPDYTVQAWLTVQNQFASQKKTLLLRSLFFSKPPRLGKTSCITWICERSPSVCSLLPPVPHAWAPAGPAAAGVWAPAAQTPGCGGRAAAAPPPSFSSWTPPAPCPGAAGAPRLPRCYYCCCCAARFSGGLGYLLGILTAALRSGKSILSSEKATYRSCPKKCCGSALVPVWIRIQLFTSMRIRGSGSTYPKQYGSMLIALKHKSWILDPDSHSPYGSDPRQPNQCGSMRNRIHNTVKNTVSIDWPPFLLVMPKILLKSVI